MDRWILDKKMWGERNAEREKEKERGETERSHTMYDKCLKVYTWCPNCWVPCENAIDVGCLLHHLL